MRLFYVTIKLVQIYNNEQLVESISEVQCTCIHMHNYVHVEYESKRVLTLILWLHTCTVKYVRNHNSILGNCNVFNNGIAWIGSVGLEILLDVDLNQFYWSVFNRCWFT